MAEEVKRIIEVEAKFETLAQLQGIIDKNKKAIEELNHHSKEYQEGLSHVKAAQAEYNREMRIAVKENTSAKGSYNDLVNQLARLKESWKQAEPGTEAFEQYTREVNRVKAQLEQMDHSIGNYQRNVGNYGNSIASISHLFGRAGQAATGAIAGVQGFTMGLRALSATPVIGTITILVGLLSKVIQSFKNSEAASMRMAEALAPLKAGGDLLRLTFEQLANGLASVAEWLGRVADKLGLYSDRMRENQAIVKESNALKLREREILIENSRLELESAKARNIAADKANHSARERVQALEQAEAAEKRILQNELEVANKKFELAKRQAALSPNDAATNDALAQAEANLYRVQTSYEQGMRRIVSQHSAALQEMRKATDKAAKEIEKAEAKTEKRIEAANRKVDNYLRTRNERVFKEDMQILLEMQRLEKEVTREVDEVSNTIAENTLTDIERQIEAVKMFRQTIVEVGTAIADIMDDVAGAYQNEIKMQVESGKISEEQAERKFDAVKALQYGVTWVNTLSAVMSAFADPTEFSWIRKAANAAVALSTGIANTIKIANTTLGNTATSSAVGQGVQTAAPAMQVAVPEYRTITSASDEQMLNQRATSQKVVLVTSELEAHNEGRRVKLAEATF